VLFDEIEKASPRICDILLQLFDDGRLTDSHGRTADARNCVFILTSNLGSSALLAAQGIADETARRKAGRRGVFSAAREVCIVL
jgi:ATP-dependent Clp protease ATP-binding subunit ClpA